MVVMVHLSNKFEGSGKMLILNLCSQNMASGHYPPTYW